MIKKIGNNIYKDFRVYYLIILLVFLLVFDYQEYWHLFSIIIKFDSWSVYGDLRLLLKGVDLYRIGKDPFEVQYEPPYNYPSFWRFFSYVKGFNASNYKIIGFFLVFCSQLLLLCASGNWYNPKKAFYYIFLLISPVSLLIFERGNNDLIIFLLLIFPIVCFPKSKLLYISCFLLAFMLKLYPIGAGLLFLYFYRNIKIKNGLVLVSVLIIIIAYIGLNYKEIIIIRERTPTSIFELSFGFFVPLRNIMFHNPTMYNIETGYWGGYICIWLCVIFLLFKVFKNKWQNIDLVNIENKKIYLFLIGSGVFLFSFFLSISWEYRLFFLMLCVPAILSWTKNNQFGSKYMIVILPLIFWNQSLRKLAEKMFSTNSNGIFIFNQLLIAFLAILFIFYISIIIKNAPKDR